MEASIANSPRRILFASLIGTTIEFFDFYTYGTAAVLVFPKLFFPAGDPTTMMLQSFATFALAFFARPIGAALFGHFGDRIGRKATLVAALMTMGASTVLIGLLPTYAMVGIAAPLLLATCRLGQGLGLGGEWGGAVLLATENAPAGRKGFYGMFPQLGAPIGFICSTGSFILLSLVLSDDQFFVWGWRIPFVASALLVWVGLYVRLRIAETPAFARAVEQEQRETLPILTVLTAHPLNTFFGTFSALATFVLFYLMTVFTLGWGTTKLGFTRQELLIIQLFGVVFFGLMIPVSALLADRYGPRAILLLATALIAGFGLFFAPMFGSGTTLGVVVFFVVGFAMMGFTYGPLGTALADSFPVMVRYTGASLAFNMAGIFGASLAPYLATSLATSYGLAYVGYYLTAAAVITFAALVALRMPLHRTP